MRGRMAALRAELAALVETAPMLRGVDGERGIFKLLPLAPDQIDRSPPTTPSSWRPPAGPTWPG
jgi:hypothetical protein